MNKRFVSALLVALALSGFARLSAQTLPGVKDSGPDDTSVRARDDYGLQEARRDFRLLALSPEEAGTIGELTEGDARDLELARAEIRELQARLARLMLEAKPDMKAIEKTVRQSLDAEYRIRMAQIRRNIALREILGDKRWAALSRLVRASALLTRKGDLRELAERAGDAEKLGLLFGILKSLQ
jgi:hypothetical protein